MSNESFSFFNKLLSATMKGSLTSGKKSIKSPTSTSSSPERFVFFDLHANIRIKAISKKWYRVNNFMRLVLIGKLSVSGSSSIEILNCRPYNLDLSKNKFSCVELFYQRRKLHQGYLSFTERWHCHYQRTRGRIANKARFGYRYAQEIKRKKTGKLPGLSWLYAYTGRQKSCTCDYSPASAMGILPGRKIKIQLGGSARSG